MALPFRFQSTRPRGARQESEGRPEWQRQSFNPRARAGRDAIDQETYDRMVKVSIHAPARGATKPAGYFQPIASGFQSTRPRGARLLESTCPQ